MNAPNEQPAPVAQPVLPSDVLESADSGYFTQIGSDGNPAGAPLDQATMLAMIGDPGNQLSESMFRPLTADEFSVIM